MDVGDCERHSGGDCTLQGDDESGGGGVNAELGAKADGGGGAAVGLKDGKERRNVEYEFISYGVCL